ncbi:MAG: radical SAM protein, partial [Bacteroidota bacterium]
MGTELSNWFLRFAITPKCNFRCEYCNPAGLKQEGNIVKEDDIIDILKAVNKVGVNRVHWTGGEPTIMDIEYLISSARQIGFKEQVMTTNGSKGGKLLRHLVDRGLSRLIVSLDTLDPERFEKVTRTKHFYDVLDTIETSVKILYAPTKVNVVYMQETKSEIPSFIEYGK